MVEELGVAKRIRKYQLSHADEILEALQSVITESRYRQKAKEMSSMWRRWREELVSPQETFAFWIETLLRGEDVSHLRIEDNELPLWHYFSLDVILFIGCIVMVKVVAMIWLSKRICSSIIRASKMISDGQIKKLKAQ